MKRKNTLPLLIGFMFILFLPIGWQTIVFNHANAQTTTLLIGAAASLQDALKELTTAFQSAHPEIRVRYNFAASGALQRQIEQGAPIDLFISASARQMDNLQKRGLILSNSRRNLLTNTLVLVVPSNSNLGLTAFSQLTNQAVKRISIGDPRSVPVGQYAEEVFRNLGILEQLGPKIVLGNSVRNVLAKVESGNADAGVVYATDAKISDQVKQVAVAPPNSHPPIVYPMAIVTNRRNQDVARTYALFLTTPKAQAVFKQYGFGIPQ